GQRNLKKIGKQYEMIYEGNGLGRTSFQAPEVDGQLLIENSENLVVGHFYTIEITGTTNYDLEAKVV
ncbi:30S ribosomal protein S12 methylthiotransferase RimO, partial [Candidatus Marinamargulisbacteria bacterium SCGC AAA071-K20]